ncbi:MAG: DUF4224 domain-containing protein [Proteobacteria bacterium]|nr:DUF4224 domain-containing protein [Pseudomonadota bacterium]
MFLSASEIESLTGRKRLRHQAKWLAQHSFPFEVNAAGFPVVLKSVVEKRLGGTTRSRPRSRPRFERLHDGKKKA